jgi:hypothetical protein
VPDKNAQIISFKPTGSAFRDLVTVKAVVGSDERISSLGILLARKFIDDPRNGIFARDIAKSFLRSTAPEPDKTHHAIQDLANQIEFCGRSGQPVISGPRKIPDFPDEPVPSYRVFLGDSIRGDIKLSACIVKLLNGDFDGEPGLWMGIEPFNGRRSSEI